MAPGGVTRGSGLSSLGSGGTDLSQGQVWSGLKSCLQQEVVWLLPEEHFTSFGLRAPSDGSESIEEASFFSFAAGAQCHLKLAFQFGWW